MAYCPSCTATYADEDYLCPDCRQPLAAGARPRASRGRRVGLVELYRCWSPLEANLLVGLLAERGIVARVRAMGIAGYPMTIAPFAEQRIAVDAALVNEARRAILRAVTDRVVSSDGGWLPA
jgi:hypothetical protein